MIIDVSQHQGKIDWEKVQPHIEGAIIRCGYGSNLEKQDDKYWEYNTSECERLGIPYGTYLYSYASNESESKSEVEHVKRLIKGKKLSYPIFLDLEESKLGSWAKLAWLIFYQELFKNYEIGIYSGEYYYNKWLQGITSECFWIAKYGKNDGEKHTEPKLKDGNIVNIWQYASKGVVLPGITSKGLDVNTTLNNWNVVSNSEVVEVAKDEKFTVGKNYKCICGLQVRRGPGLAYGRKSWSELTANGRKCDKDKNGCFDKGTIITCQNVVADSIGNIFIQCPSGWVRGMSSDGDIYLKKV